MPAGANITLRHLPGALACTALTARTWRLQATTRVVPTPMLGGQKRRAGCTPFYPRVAPSAAPGILPHHIFVIPCCSRWYLELADAVCWGLVVEEVRSGPHDRVGPLGFFIVDGIFAQLLLFPWAAPATFGLMSTPAHSPPCPLGDISVAPPIVRAVARLADSNLALAV